VSALARLRAQGDALPGNVRGVLWILAASFMLTVMFAAIKRVVADEPAFVVALFRTLIAFLCLLPWAARGGLPAVRTRRPFDHLLRSACGIGAFACLTFALENLILSDAMVLTFSYPLWTILIAAAFMGERVRLRRTLATIAGFIGVVLVVKPQGGISPAALLALASAVLSSLALFNVKRLTSTEPPQRIVFYFFFFGVLMLAGPAIWTWKTPTLEQFAWLAVSGVTGVIGQTWLTNAYKAGDMTVIQPMDFTRVPMAAAIGFVMWGEVPDALAATGTVIIICASAYIVYRDAQLRRQAKDAV
jgi:drug/metabolite transporter (DMT)-like permease